MGRAYLELAKKSFQQNIAYRSEYVAGVVNAIVMIFVNIAIWKAVYEEDGALEGVQFKLMATYIVMSFLMQTLYVMDEYAIERKVRSGLITSDLLKPMHFRLNLFAVAAGTFAFRCVLQLVPAFVLSLFLFDLLPPFSFTMLLYFLASAILGYLVLYNLNFIVWISSFWFYWTFSLVTIKETAVMILSGALIPLWFMPIWLQDAISYTPFAAIYYTPIRIYLGMVPENEILANLATQSLWLLGLAAAGHLLWKSAARKLVVQGG